MADIKICGLFRECDIDFVNEAGPEYIGFILRFPASHRCIEPEQAALLRKKLAPGIRAVGVFVDQPPERVCEDARNIGLDVIQLHGSEDEAYLTALRRMTPLPLWKAFRIRNLSDLERAAESSADEILLDSGYGTGNAFDWSLAKGFSRPFILAGGLNAQLIAQARKRLAPHTVDLSSGVETDGVKDREKILAAVRAAHARN